MVEILPCQELSCHTSVHRQSHPPRTRKQGDANASNNSSDSDDNSEDDDDDDDDGDDDDNEDGDDDEDDDDDDEKKFCSLLLQHWVGRNDPVVSLGTYSKSTEKRAAVRGQIGYIRKDLGVMRGPRS